MYTSEESDMKEYVLKKCEQEWVSMQLQRFSDENEENNSELGQGNEGESQTITFASQADFDAEIDKRLTKALADAKKTWQAESEQAIQAAQTEAERLAGLTAEEKEKEIKKQQEAALNARLAEVTRRELRAQALETLAEKELPKELINAVVLSDADACNQSIEAVEKAFRAAVEIAVSQRLAGAAGAPTIFNGSQSPEKGAMGKRLAEQNKQSQTGSKFF